MKTRQGFVSNSSSSSFLILKAMLSPVQIQMIHQHAELGEELGFSCSNQPWTIEETEHGIRGETDMDNFDMRRYLKLINVPEDAIHWGD